MIKPRGRKKGIHEERIRASWGWNAEKKKICLDHQYCERRGRARRTVLMENRSRWGKGKRQRGMTR